MFSWTLVCELLPNYEVMMFQPWTGTTQDLGSFAYCYVAIILIPALTLSARHHMSARGGYPLMPLTSLHLQPSCLHTGSLYHPGITCLCHKIPGLLAPCIRLCCLPDPPPSPRLLYSQRCALARSEISSNVALNCVRAAVFLHHVSQRLPPPS